jgi:hypothetical protein
MRCRSRRRPRTMRSRSRSLRWGSESCSYWTACSAGTAWSSWGNCAHSQPRVRSTWYAPAGPGRRARHPAPAVTPVRVLWPGCSVAAGVLLAPDLKEAAFSVRDRVARDGRAPDGRLCYQVSPRRAGESSRRGSAYGYAMSFGLHAARSWFREWSHAGCVRGGDQ